MRPIVFYLCLLCVISACSSTAPTLTPTEAATLVPTWTPIVRATLPPTWTPAPVTPAPTTLPIALLDPLTGVSEAPPYTLNLPSGWRYGFDTMLFQDVLDTGDVFSLLPIALYQGPVTGGTGTMVLLWRFGNITSGVDLGGTVAADPVNLWVDGLRFLRVLVMPAGCEISTGPQRDSYRVGGLAATGTDFTVAACTDGTPDTQGWFTALNVEGLNFAFYLYTDPLTAMNGPAEAELQAILDSIVFQVAAYRQALAERTPEATPEITPEGGQ